MESVHPFMRGYYNFLSRLFALLHSLRRRSILGLPLLAIILWSPILILIYGWLARWSSVVVWVITIFTVCIVIGIWHSGRSNFSRFIPDKTKRDAAQRSIELPEYHKIPIEVTGLFSVSGHEDTLLLAPANIWRVPLGEHVIMAEERPGKYLYQFLNPEAIQKIESGWLLHGHAPIETIAVTFLARWGPAYTRFGQENGEFDHRDLPAAKSITIYLSTKDHSLRQDILCSIIDKHSHHPG